MNTLIYYGIEVLILAAIILIIGMIKPKWILLWMDQPGRMPIAIIATVLFMIGMVLFGEGNKTLQKEKQAQTQTQQLQPKPSSEAIPTDDVPK